MEERVSGETRRAGVEMGVQEELKSLIMPTLTPLWLYDHVCKFSTTSLEVRSWGPGLQGPEGRELHIRTHGSARGGAGGLDS